MRTLIIASLLFLVLFVLLLTMPVPYVVLSPGPTYNTLGTDPVTGSTIIVIKGKKPTHTTGNLNLTTVSVSTESVTALQALSAWLRGDEVVVPRAAVYPPGQSDEQVNQQNTQDFITSQDNATAAALCELDYPRGFGVLDVTAKGPSDGLLHLGDIIRTVAGKPAASSTALAAVLSKQKPGKTVPVVVTRNDKPASVDVRLGPPLKDRTGASLGIVVTTGCLAPFTVDLGLANQIGGPSAGLMFALGIMDKVGTTDLTGGKFIAGTGTIDAKGNVGAIGGIQLKMIAARDKGASVFLAPAGNCSDVNGAVPDGLQIVKVSTLHGAVQDLLRIQHGESVPSC
ncbi:MAG: Lon-like protease [Pseudonocardiales bacterium]|nr:Lon-like protease [Pseudonocardiales bacterium]